MENINNENLPSVIVFGKSGSGKSYLCTKMTGIEGLFEVGDELDSCTNEIKSVPVKILDKKIVLIDTAGFCENRNDRIEINILRDIQNLLLEMSKGINLVLIVIDITDKRLDMYPLEKIIELIGKENLDRCYFVLNQGETLKSKTSKKTKQDQYSAQIPNKIKENYGITIQESQMIIFESKNIHQFLDKINPSIFQSQKFYQKNSFLVKIIYEDILQRVDPQTLRGMEAITIAAFSAEDKELYNIIKSRLQESKFKIDIAKENALKNPSNQEYQKIYQQMLDDFKKSETEYVGLFKVGLQVAAQGGVKLATNYGLKASAKAIPIVGLVVGTGFGVYRFMNGQWVLGGLEIAGGAVSLIPVYGTAASFGISAGIAGYELKTTSSKNKK